MSANEETDAELLDWLNEYAQQRLAAAQKELTRQWEATINNPFQLTPCIRRAIRAVKHNEESP